MMRVKIEGAVLELRRRDITREDTDAVVNAANSTLLGGGGVDGAIHRAGGPMILQECQQIRARRGPLPPGQAVLTVGGQLSARHVIHTVGPVWRGGQEGEEDQLRSCYRSCLVLARENHLQSLAFPSISTGAYCYPVNQAARIALATVSEELAAFSGVLQLVRFVLFDDDTLLRYAEALTKLRTISLSST